MEVQIMKEKNYIYLIYLLLVLLSMGCTRQIANVVAPLNSKLEELSDIVEDIDVPVEVAPDAKFRFKSRKLTVEKRF